LSYKSYLSQTNIQMDTQNLNTILKELHRESYTWALCCVSNNEDLAKDVLQTVYLKILEKKATFSGKSGIKSWLFSVIRFTAIDLLKKESRTFEELTVVDDSHEDHQQYHLLLDQLSKRQKEVLLLVFYYDMTLEQAAASLQISVGSARTHYHRGKESLKELIIAQRQNETAICHEK